jgi:hypothetical protein
MARLKKGNLKKPWRAECKINYQTYYLGYHETKELALEDERTFRFGMTGKSKAGSHSNCLCPSHKKRSAR